MTYPESHEPYSDDLQDAYNTQQVHYTAYGFAPSQQQGMTAQGQSPYQYSSITPPDAGYPMYTQPSYYGYGQPTVPYAPDAQSQQMAYAQPKPVTPSMKQPQANKVMKRSKAESLALVNKLRKWIIAASVVSFGTLSFLVAGNVVGVTSHTSSSSSTSSKSSSSVTTPSQSSSSNGSYFQQGQSQSQSNQGGYGFGNSSSSSQGAFSSSSTS